MNKANIFAGIWLALCVLAALNQCVGPRGGRGNDGNCPSYRGADTC